MLTDDNSMSAHKALLQRDIKSNEAVAQQDTSKFNLLAMNTDYGTQCYRTGNCMNLDTPGTIQPLCGSGEANIGFDRSDCKGNWVS